MIHPFVQLKTKNADAPISKGSGHLETIAELKWLESRGHDTAQQVHFWLAER